MKALKYGCRVFKKSESILIMKLIETYHLQNLAVFVCGKRKKFFFEPMHKKKFYHGDHGEKQ